MKPLIFDGPVDQVPSGFNAVTLHIEAKTTSTLKWDEAREQALKARSNGLNIFWEMDLGLFKELVHPLSSESQLRTLGLGIEHFFETLWQDFEAESLGLSIWRGQLPFDTEFPWDLEQETLFQESSKECKEEFAQEVMAQYLNFLSSFIPGPITPYLLLDVSKIKETSDLIRALDDTFTHRYQRVIKGSRVATRDMAWEERCHVPIASRGFLGTKLPALSETEALVGLFYTRGGYQQTLPVQCLEKRHIPYRLVSEEHLITDWDHLDHIVVNPEGLQREGVRRLQGFAATGGTIVTTGAPIGIGEISFDEWLSHLEITV